jgi:hypothetical protein
MRFVIFSYDREGQERRICGIVEAEDEHDARRIAKLKYNLVNSAMPGESSRGVEALPLAGYLSQADIAQAEAAETRWQEETHQAV